MNLQSVAASVATRLGHESRLVRALRPTYERVLSVVNRGRGMRYVINGETYRIDPRYRSQLGTEYDSHVAQYLRARVQPGAVCWNVGANIGVYPLQFSRWIGSKGSIVAFEPNPGAQEVMARHIAWNGITEQTTVVPMAVADFTGHAEFHGAAAEGMSRLGAPAPPLEGRTIPTRVAVTTLDAYRATTRAAPDWLVIDVEGAEIAVLRGARRLIAEKGTALGIVVELHPGAWRRDGLTRAMFMALCAELGRRPMSLSAHDPFDRVGHVALEPA
jgi:FkbM family methyltransferase